MLLISNALTFSCLIDSPSWEASFQERVVTPTKTGVTICGYAAVLMQIQAREPERG